MNAPLTHLTYAGFNYLDRTLALQLGELQPKGVDLRFVTIPEIGALFRRMAPFAEFEAAEMSLSTLLILRGMGDDRFVGLPVFPSRVFQHGFMFVRADSPIQRLGDLRRARIGVQDYQATASLWLRGLLADHGVSAREVHWLVGGLDVATPEERLRHAPPPGVRIDVVPARRTLERMLVDGELDAIYAPERLHAFGRGEVRRLIPDHVAAERAFHAATGFFPIMHVVALRRDVYDAAPAIATSLVDVFEASQRAGYELLKSPTSPALELPWLADAVAELERDFGGDLFPIGFEANRAILQEMARMSHAQGLTPLLVPPEELFAPETLVHVPAPVADTRADREARS